MRHSDAIIRFGWGARPDEATPGDGHGWLAAQLDGPDSTAFEGLGSSADGLIALRTQRREKMSGGALVKSVFEAEAREQLGHLLTTDRPFRERLVWFWANYFTVSTRQGGTKAVVGAYLREAIRPHVTGRFVEMLTAVMRHPAMLMYLDNVSSIGPHSTIGQRRHKGLNENLARECLELHTLSPASGYTQSDVTQFATLLTGWGVNMKADRPGFLFRARAHEPGGKTLLDRSFPDGENGGMAALAFIGTHPATYRHIAFRMAQHFFVDAPDDRTVMALAKVLEQTGGDLKSVSLALLDQSARHPPAQKFRSPLEFAVAALRATAPSLPAAAGATMLHHAVNALGQPLWNAPLPNGWSERSADWAAPADMLARVDWSYQLAARAHGIDPDALLPLIFGERVSRHTRDAVRHAGSRAEGLTLLLSSPEFQRR